MKWVMMYDKVICCNYLARKNGVFGDPRRCVTFVDILNDIVVACVISKELYNNMPSTTNFELSCREIADHVKRVKSAMEEEK